MRLQLSARSQRVVCPGLSKWLREKTVQKVCGALNSVVAAGALSLLLVATAADAKKKWEATGKKVLDAMG